MENTEKKGNAWTNFVKDWAATNNMKYMVAIKDEEVKQAYKDSKKQKKKLVIVDNFEKLKGDAVAMAEAIDPPPVKKKAGRPSKYANDEERKEAKRLKTLASNKKKREEIQAKKKAGTMTEEEGYKYGKDSDMNVERTIKMRAKRRAEAIAKYEAVYNKMRNYIKDNEKEYFKNFSKDPFKNRYGDEDWEPTGKYQERAVEIFGKETGFDFGRSLEKHILTKDELDLLDNEKNHIPNFEYGWNKARQDLDEIKEKLAKKVSVIQYEGKKEKEKERKGMMEDDPHEKRVRLKREAERKIKDLGEWKKHEAEQKKRNEAEELRRSLLMPHQRQEEDDEVKKYYDMLMGTRGGALGGDKGKRWVSLVDKGFWN